MSRPSSGNWKISIPSKKKGVNAYIMKIGFSMSLPTISREETSSSQPVQKHPYFRDKVTVRQADSSARGFSLSSSRRRNSSPYLPVKLAFMPARLRMASSSACLTDGETITEIEMLTICEASLTKLYKSYILSIVCKNPKRRFK
jgi:hypothetical protein